MIYLLDTHILIWALINPEKLSLKVKAILCDPNDTILVSSINLWEISMKFGSGKLLLGNLIPEDFINVAIKTGFKIKNLSAEETSSSYKLNGDFHKDPFDRMLIWQAIHNNYTLISDDRFVKMYKESGLKVLS